MDTVISVILWTAIAAVSFLCLRWGLLWLYAKRFKPAPELKVVPGAFARLAASVLGEPPHPVTQDGKASTTQDSGSAVPPKAHETLPSEGKPRHLESFAKWFAASADGAAPAVDVWTRWSSVDDHVFQAVSHMTHEQIESVADLFRVVEAKGYLVGTEGFFNKLLGHLGEWHVQEHLMAAGHAVAMPFGTNEPAVDMWVDGHGVNVKTVQDVASAAHEHFAAHPDVPIIVPADAANIPDDALYFDPSNGLDTAVLDSADHTVIVDTALSHAELAQQAKDAIDVLENPAPDAHVPWVTIAISAFREGRLLVEGNTDLLRAAKNVAVDAAAVGGGAALGAKIGAAVGSAFGPVGTAAGGAIGGLIGALAGRAVANEIRLEPLKQAKAEYETSLERYRSAEQEAIEYAKREWEHHKTAEQSRLGSKVQKIEKRVAATLPRLRRRLGAAKILKESQARSLLNKCEKQIGPILEHAQQKLDQKVLGVRRLFAVFLAPREYAELRAVKKEARLWKRKAKKLLEKWEPNAESTAKVFDLVMALPGGEEKARSHLERVRGERQQAYVAMRSCVVEGLVEAIQARVQAVDRLRNAWSRIEDEVRERLEPLTDALKASANRYRCELRKAGILA